MDVLLFIKKENYKKLKEILLKDEKVSRASVTFREAKAFGEKEGYFCYIRGTDEQCERVLELIKLAEEVKGEEKEEIINKIKEEEEKSVEGLGGILG